MYPINRGLLTNSSNWLRCRQRELNPSSYSAVEVAGVEVSDENTSKEYEGVSAHMISLVEQYKFNYESCHTGAWRDIMNL